jgi:type I restriction enzyme S subunit
MGMSCSLLKDGTHLPPKRVQNGPLLLSVQNMIDGGFRLTPNDTKVTWAFYRTMHANWSIQEGDVLLAVVGATIGKTAAVPKLPLFTLQRSVAVLRGRDGMLRNDFLLHWMNTRHFQACMWQKANQTAQPGIYLGELAKLLIPLPDWQEQERISRGVGLLEMRIDKEEAYRDKLKRQKRGLMHDLLTGRVRV